MPQSHNLSTPLLFKLTTLSFHPTDSTATTTLISTILTVPTPSDCDLFDFIVWGCVVMFLCQLGYIGNVLSFMALQRDKRSATITLLQSLSVSDIILLFSVNITDSLPYLCHFTQSCPNPWVSWPHIRYIWLFTPIAHMTSIWLVVLVAANRYWAVCKPHLLADTWSVKKTKIYVSCVVVASFVFNSARFFEYQIVDVPFPLHNTQQNEKFSSGLNLFNTSNHHLYPISKNASNFSNLKTNQTSKQHLHYSSPFSTTTISHKKMEKKTCFGQSRIYKVGYKVVVVNLLLVLLPLTFLFFTSVWIIRAVKVSENKRQGQQKRRRQKSLVEESVRKNNHSKEVTFTLVAVVLVAVTCQTPLAIFHCLRYAIDYKCGSVVYYLESASKLLVNVNSCVNFFVYYVLSPRFRRLLSCLIKCQSNNNITTTKTLHNNKSLQSNNKKDIVVYKNNETSIKQNFNETATAMEL